MGAEEKEMKELEWGRRRCRRWVGYDEVDEEDQKEGDNGSIGEKSDRAVQDKKEVEKKCNVHITENSYHIFISSAVYKTEDKSLPQNLQYKAINPAERTIYFSRGTHRCSDPAAYSIL